MGLEISPWVRMSGVTTGLFFLSLFVACFSVARSEKAVSGKLWLASYSSRTISRLAASDCFLALRRGE